MNTWTSVPRVYLAINPLKGKHFSFSICSTYFFFDAVHQLTITIMIDWTILLLMWLIHIYLLNIWLWMWWLIVWFIVKQYICSPIWCQVDCLNACSISINNPWPKTPVLSFIIDYPVESASPLYILTCTCV